MEGTERKVVRCAIYTRKSREDGLEQEFNSLDAQREAALAFIASQKFNGWRPLEKEYSDGGFTGANTDRPALQELMKDVAAGLIDVVVVYKVDRLSRSLADFADLMKKFEEHHVAFVSATQQLDTSSPMGRMVLNILITFAEFEREMIRTRIIDKIDATKKKGMWVGGRAPLGYKVVDKKLVIDGATADTVRFVFRRFVECGSVALVARELAEKGIDSPMGGKWTTEGIYKILRRHVYIGKVFYKDHLYDGQHEAIVDEALWQKAQDTIANNKPEPGRRRIDGAPPLRGILFCKECGCAMQYTWYKKGPKRYGYYVCSRDKKAPAHRCEVGSVSAFEVERLVFGQMGRILQSEAFVELLSEEGEVPKEDVRRSVSNLPAFFDALFPEEKRQLVRLLVERAELGRDGLDIELKTNGFRKLINGMLHDDDDTGA